MSIADLRRDYSLASLRRSDLESDPIEQFKKWFEDAAGVRRSGWIRKFLIRAYKLFYGNIADHVSEPNVATLATFSSDGWPSARIILLKGVDRRGFVFFTNYNSRKGHHLAENPRAALVFYWPELERQVCVEGEVAKISHEESEAYFKTRPRGSRLAALASHQSEVISSREELAACWRKLQAQYAADDNIPMSPDWGGYLVSPVRVEFWQGRPSRLHDRFRYLRDSDKHWRVERLSP